MEHHLTLDVIIPTYKPDDTFRELISRLSGQTYPIDHILVINTEEEYWKVEFLEGVPNAEVFQIEKSEFDHGATRDMGAGFSDADILVYMTQDALPCDEFLIENLVKAMQEPMVKAAYARQLPKGDCGIAEGCVRISNYPEESERHRGSGDTGSQNVLLLQCLRGVRSPTVSGAGRFHPPLHFQ